MAATFADIEALAEGCRFGDCRHRGEPGCAEVAAGASTWRTASRTAREASRHKPGRR